MVFAPDSYQEPSGQFYHDMTNSYHLSGLSHLDNFIVTRKSCPLTGPDSYRDLQKHMPTLTQTATPHTTGPLAKIQLALQDIRLPALQVIKYIMIRDFLPHLSVCTPMRYWCFKI
jgi:hypothetical protein